MENNTMMVSLYRFEHNLEIVEKGECDCGQALALLDECYSKDLHTFNSSEDAASATSFGLSKSDEDFIEISCDGNGNVSVHSDRIHYPSWISKRMSLKNHLYIKGEKESATRVIRDFYQLERQAFEEKYAKHLCR